ncbi:hypothetical protein AABC73_14860 [Pseudomonas sp. G.S.17]|uniref:hypothetical protein n=1 Tax=Pseudomonas sp. G.S.17 TaxID=3137451 RepID=UPI00311CDF3B
MTDFITVADVDALLGSGWAGAGDPVMSVMQANAWLTSKIKRPVPAEVPAEIKQAGAQVAKIASTDGLYKSVERETISETVSATSGTSVSETYVQGSVALSAGESFAMALIYPWAVGTNSIPMIRG